jgi:hypothetical protein
MKAPHEAAHKARSAQEALHQQKRGSVRSPVFVAASPKQPDAAATNLRNT